MRGKITFRQGAVQHIYQKTINGFLIFYSTRDCLVFFTILATAARRYHVRILGICLMVDHVHILAEARSKRDIDLFVRLDKARAPMRRAIEEVKISRREDRPLNFAQLKRITKPLLTEEQQQLTDFIVQNYNCVDYADLLYRYGNYNDLVMAINTTTGSEYVIKEDFVGRSDRIYQKMSAFLLESHRIECMDELLHLTESERRALIAPLGIRTGASRRQLEKYLHLS